MIKIKAIHKTLAAAFAAAGVITIASSFIKPSPAKPPVDDLSGTISISGAFALYPITVKWADEFKKLHPNVKFNISAGGGFMNDEAIVITPAAANAAASVLCIAFIFIIVF